MSLIRSLVYFLAFSIICLIFLHIHVQTSQKSAKIVSGSSNIRDSAIDELLKVIQLQNETIHKLHQTLEANAITTDSTATFPIPLASNTLFQKVISQKHRSSTESSGYNNSKACGTLHSYVTETSSFEQECEKRYGLELVKSWAENGQTWCDSGEKTEDRSRLVCYPYHQNHKKLARKGSDVFCEAFNFVIDFSKVRGTHSTGKKPPLGNQYLSFDSGSLLSSCKKTNSYRTLFMPHHSLQMRGFKSETNIGSSADYKVEPLTTYLLARDEDCENSFHSTADFMNMYLVKTALGLDLSKTQVMLFDKHPDGPYHELIKEAFSPNYPILRHQDYNGKKIWFRHLVFHLESPAALIFPKVSKPDPMRCYETSLFDAYRRHVLQSFNLLDVPPPAIPSVTLTLRHRSKQKNVGRVMANEQQVIDVLKKGNMMDLNIVDTSKMSYRDQLELARKTNVLVGIHGAGLMFIMFAAEEAVLVEIHPSYRQDRHFRHAARLTGKIYMPLRAVSRETCVGSSDSVTVPIEEFTKTIDGAVRIARNFDDGLSECGLICNPGILALDTKLDKFYKNGERKGKPINTKFPCG